MEVLLSQPRGFCAGVVRAIDIVEMALELYGAPVYVYHEIVHNPFVVDDLRQRGAVFVESLENVPEGSVTIFSAHGVADEIVKQASTRKLDVIDATCPLVTKVHLQARKYSLKGYSIIIIGHMGHEEVTGTMGSVSGPVYVVPNADDVYKLPLDNSGKIAYVTQTTLSIDDTREVITALKDRFPDIQGPELDDICYATQNRQMAVHELAKKVDLILVVGARNSSNSNRLREVGEQCKLPAYLIQDEGDLQPEWLENVTKIGITAGASSPEILVERVIKRLKSLGVSSITEMPGEKETTQFRLPRKLLQAKSA
ncbi:MAG: 4-hydroxy-3-methylbut-2-enyl diphosphate reductase [Gammaproteobacteria bacterium]